MIIAQCLIVMSVNKNIVCDIMLALIQVKCVFIINLFIKILIFVVVRVESKFLE